MAATVIQPHEGIEVKHICALIYGQPGARKSSLCQTADNPITLAFDQGIYRAFSRKTAVLFDSWADVISFDLRPYRTIVVDTIGMALEKLMATIIAASPKNGNRMGGMSLPGYGILKTQFASWVSSIRELGIDLVFTAHEKGEKLGDETYHCPEIVGGSYATVMNVCDVVGYCHFEGGKRVIDFAPSDRFMAKTPPCGWTQLLLPDFASSPDFLAKLLADAKASMGRVSEESAKIAGLVESWREWLASDPSLAQVNARITAEFPNMDKTAKPQVWKLVTETMTRAGVLWDAQAKAFKAPTVPLGASA